jgi:pimeloyl-ACP methyl ester carboxylesterase/quinol monooxygenase YgiN
MTDHGLDACVPENHQAVQLLVEVKARADAATRLRAELRRLVDATHREDDGVVRFEVGADPDDETRYVGYEIWASQDALDRHSTKPHTRYFLDVAKELVVDPARPLDASRWVPMRAETPARYRDGPAEAAEPPPGFSHQTLTTRDGAELHYVIGGQGPTVILLHGFPNTWYSWRDVMPTLAADRRVVAADLRGLGDSSAGSLPNDVPTGAADVHDLVSHLGCRTVSIFGQDWGGSTAFAYAAAHQDEVSHLGVFEALPRGPWTDPGAPSGAWFADFHQIPDLPEELITGNERPYLDWFYRAYTSTAVVPSAEAVDEYLRTYIQPGKMESALARYRGVEAEIAHNAEHLAGPLAIPVLAVGGANVFGSEVADNLRSAATDLHEVVVADCGHYVAEERPQEIAELIADFLGS